MPVFFPHRPTRNSPRVVADLAERGFTPRRTRTESSGGNTLASLRLPHSGIIDGSVGMKPPFSRPLQHFLAPFIYYEEAICVRCPSQEVYK